MVYSREGERRVENDTARRCPLNELQQQGGEHPRRLADEEDDRHDEQGAR